LNLLNGEIMKNILISGTMRSGTTLMCSALNSHKDIALCSDILSWFWKRCFGQYGDFNNEFLLDKALFELEPYIFYGLTKEQKELYTSGIIRSQVIEQGISYYTLYRILIELYTGKKTSTIGIKSTHFNNYRNFIHNTENPLIIHMTRNGKDVLYSHFTRVKKNRSIYSSIRRAWTILIRDYLCTKQLKKYIKMGERIFTPYVYNNPIKIIDEWVELNQEALSLKEEFPDNVIIVRYEDFISDQESIFRNIIEKLGINWIDGFYNYENLTDRNGKQFVANSSHKINKNGYIKSSISKSKGKLSADYIKYYEEKTSSIIDLLGYQN